MEFIDTHVHLDHMENLDEELRLARESGVKAVVAMSVDVASCLKNLQIIQRDHGLDIFLAMGVHPSEANLLQAEQCARLIREHRGGIKAVGEVGLDFWYKWVRDDDEKKDLQKQVFRLFCDLARETDLPVVVHSRGAQKHCLEILKQAGVRKAVFHWYDASVKILQTILDAGYLISATPNLAYNQAAREAIDYAPIDRVLMETDSPVKFFNRLTEEEFQAGPKDVRRTLAAYAALKGMEESAAAERLNRNATDFFSLGVDGNPIRGET